MSELIRKFNKDKTDQLQDAFNAISKSWMSTEEWLKFTRKAVGLIAQGAHPDIAGKQDRSLLIEAIHQKDYEFIDFLIESNVDARFTAPKRQEYPPIRAALLSRDRKIAGKLTRHLIHQGQDNICRLFNDLHDAYHSVNWADYKVRTSCVPHDTLRESVQELVKAYDFKDLRPHDLFNHHRLISAARKIRDHVLENKINMRPDNNGPKI